MVAVVVLFLLFILGFLGGLIGASIVGDVGLPSIFRISGKPHIELISEKITSPLFSLGSLGDFSISNTLIASWLTIIVLIVVAYFATRKMRLIPGRLQCLVESGLEMLLNFVEATAGKRHGRMFFPLVATIFIMVMFNAYIALLPFFGPGIFSQHEGIPLFRSAGTDVNMPLSIAIVAVIFIEYCGMKNVGTLRYIGEFVNLKQLRQGIGELFRGKPRSGFANIMFGFINLFVGVLETVSHLIRIISFTFRLFGNMTAGEILLLVMLFLVPLIAVLPFYGLELLVGFLQALIFAGLTLVFATVAVTPHGEEHE